MCNPCSKSGYLDWLLQIVGSSAANCLDRGLGCVVCRHKQHIDRRIEAHHLIKNVQTAEPWHHQIRDDEARTHPAYEFKSFHGVPCGMDRDTCLPQSDGEHFHASGVVVDDHELDRFSHGTMPLRGVDRSYQADSRRASSHAPYGADWVIRPTSRATSNPVTNISD